MGRKIILLSDGTGNSSAKVWRTNVWRTFEALDLSGNDQIAFYDDGVGTSSFKPMAILGGAFGLGLRRNVIALYKFACRNYHNADDELYGFGFSRGAFAIRSLAGFIDLAGLPKQPRALKEEELLEIYDAYMDGQLVDKARYGTIDTMLDFIGVWDTVGALAFGRTLGNFHRINPGNVRRVAHALALDEERERFEPSYWDPPARAVTQIDEVWFSGCHTNIGGGYVDANLSNIALFWMLQSARDAGLPLDARGIPGFDLKDPRGLQRDSYKEFYDSMGLIGGIAESLNLKREPRVIRAGQRIHQSVVDRTEESSGQQPYVPKALFAGKPLSAESNPGIQPWGGF